MHCRGFRTHIGDLADLLVSAMLSVQAMHASLPGCCIHQLTTPAAIV